MNAEDKEKTFITAKYNYISDNSDTAKVLEWIVYLLVNKSTELQIG